MQQLVKMLPGAGVVQKKDLVVHTSTSFRSIIYITVGSYLKQVSNALHSTTYHPALQTKAVSAAAAVLSCQKHLG